jgi:hypothetical protein
MSKLEVAILGCGPAGLLAAESVAQHGGVPHIYSERRVQSQMPGAIFLHEAIPSVTAQRPDEYVLFQKLGTKQGYARKVYGFPEAECSWDKFPEGRQPAWDLKEVYDRLWSRWSLDVREERIGPRELLGLDNSYELVISTIPPRSYCLDERHAFADRTVWIAPHHRDACEQLGDPSIIYNGQDSDPYYRSSLLWGHGATEYGNLTDAVSGVINKGVKPLWTDCDCFPRVQRVGRFGKWQRGVLVHEAFWAVRGLMLNAVQ